MDNRIKELRLEKGLTLKEMGNELGIRDNTLSQYETGKRTPQFGLIQEIANYFNVSVEYLTKSSDKRDFPVDNDDDVLELLEKLGNKDISFYNVSQLTATYLFLWLANNFDVLAQKANDKQLAAASQVIEWVDRENTTLKLYSESRKRDNEIIDKIDDILLYSEMDGYPSPSEVLEFMEQSKRIGGLATEKIINTMKNTPDCPDDSY